MKKYRIIILLLIASCSNNAALKEKLGVSYRGPDEFAIYTNPSLVVPNEFALPQPGTQDLSPNEDNIKYLLTHNHHHANPTIPTKAEQNLVNRFKVKDERAIEPHANKFDFFHKLWGKYSKLTKSSVADSAAEVGDRHYNDNPQSLNVLNSTNFKDPRRICNASGGVVQYCDSNKFMKTFTLPLDSESND